MIGKPYAIANIPSDSTGAHCAVFAADVVALSSSGKRKRSELALAVERQGINIYDIRSSRLTTSYAISPEANVTCPPCSLRIRPAKGQLAQRFTYCSVKAPRAQILGFVEECTGASAPGTISTCSIDVKSPSPIVSLDVIPLTNENIGQSVGHRLIATHRDGQVDTYNSSLSEEWSLQSPNEKQSEKAQIQYATSLSAEQARKSLFKQREDLQTLAARSPVRPGSSLLLTVSSKRSLDDSGTNTLHVQVCLISSPLAEILSFDIATPPTLKGTSSNFSFHPGSATLYQQSTQDVAVYDLSEPIPRLKHSIHEVKGDMMSFHRINADLIATTTKDTLKVTSLPYCSLQASQTLDGRYSDMKSPRRANSQKGPAPVARLTLLWYSTQLKLAVVIDGGALIAVPMVDSHASEGLGSRKRTRDGFLINSLGRGNSIAQAPQSEQAFRTITSSRTSRQPLVEDDPTWQAQKIVIDDHSCRKEPDALDKEMMPALQPVGHKHSHIDHNRASYLLSKIYDIHREDSAFEEGQKGLFKLKVALWPPKCARWLLSNSLMTKTRIGSALKQYGKLSLNSQLAPGALVDAIAESDVTLERLQAMLGSPIPLSAAEGAYALAHVSHQIGKDDKFKNTRMLTDGEILSDAHDGASLQLSNGHGEENHHPLAAQDIDREGNTTRRLLYLVMNRLHGHPSASVTVALRDAFSKPQLRSLVDLLRFEIARSGWLSPYEGHMETAADNPSSGGPLVLISHLLNSILDALGPTGWMSGAPVSDLTDAAETISYMKAEISAALEGIEEATYLKGVLGEILLCGKGSLVPPKAKALTNVGGYDGAVDHVKPVTLKVEDALSNLLPLGLKLQPPRLSIKVGAGGELKQRSKRDMGRLLSKKVGKYSFERIEV